MKNALAIIISFVLVSSSFAQDFQENKESKLSKEDLTNYALSSNKVSLEKDIKDKFHKSISAESEKSPVLGGVLSALVPGAGEFYAKSYLKAGIFLAVEAGLWIGYATFQNKSNTQTDIYKAYADANWSVRKYAQWIHDKVPGGEGVDPTVADLNVLRSQLNAVESAKFSHTLPVYGTQQYYELIGKYQSFVAGWSDAVNSVIVYTQNYADPYYYENYKTTRQVDYSYTRQKSNDYYDTSMRFVMGAILNHVLSAADGVWSVTMFNKKIGVNTGMRVEERYGGMFMEKYSLPTANLSIQF